MLGYFAGKRSAEEIVEQSGIPWTTLRATQFHDLTLKTVEAIAKMPIVPVPAGWRVQPVDAGEVADRLVELALAAPAGLAPSLGGPRVYEMDDLVRSYLQRLASSGRSSTCLCQVRRRAGTARGRISRPIEPWADGRGKSFSPSGSVPAPAPQPSVVTR